MFFPILKDGILKNKLASIAADRFRPFASIIFKRPWPGSPIIPCVSLKRGAPLKNNEGFIFLLRITFEGGNHAT